LWNSKTCFLRGYNFSTRFVGIEILAAAYVIRDNEATNMPRYKLDAKFAVVVYMEQPLVISGNLNCGKSCSQWMKAFAEKLDAMV
jgi:hypothetical protein